MKQFVRIVISGNVQEVSYRDFVKKNAELLEVEGFIQNDDDGCVSISASGFSENLDKFVDFLYLGSKNSEVRNLLVYPLICRKDFHGVFRIIGSLTGNRTPISAVRGQRPNR